MFISSEPYPDPVIIFIKFDLIILKKKKINFIKKMWEVIPEAILQSSLKIANEAP